LSLVFSDASGDLSRWLYDFTDRRIQPLCHLYKSTQALLIDECVVRLGQRYLLRHSILLALNFGYQRNVKKGTGVVPLRARLEMLTIRRPAAKVLLAFPSGPIHA